MTIELTQQQQQAIDNAGDEPVSVIDPRTKTEYIMVPAVDYDSVREALEDDRIQRAIRSTAHTNAI